MRLKEPNGGSDHRFCHYLSVQPQGDLADGYTAWRRTERCNTTGTFTDMWTNA
jgi:hypothetical protein